jgi:hypothetical protein
MTDTIERNHMTLANEIDGSVIIDDAVYNATVVGITSDDQFVVIFNDGVSIQARRVKTVFPNERHAEATLKNRLADRRVLAEYDVRQAEREQQATA